MSAIGLGTVLLAAVQGVICGVVTRMMTNAKKPMSAAVTAIIAPNRAAPILFRKSASPCKQPPHRFGRFHWKGRLGNYCLGDGFDMVNEG